MGASSGSVSARCWEREREWERFGFGFGFALRTPPSYNTSILSGWETKTKPSSDDIFCYHMWQGHERKENTNTSTDTVLSGRRALKEKHQKCL